MYRYATTDDISKEVYHFMTVARNIDVVHEPAEENSLYSSDHGDYGNHRTHNYNSRSWKVTRPAYCLD